MSGYIPHTDDVAMAYIHATNGDTWVAGRADALRAEFYRWLAEVKAEEQQRVIKLLEMHRLPNCNGDTDESGYCLTCTINLHDAVDIINAKHSDEQFDHWLAGVKAEAWKEGYVAGFLQAMGGTAGPSLPGLSTKENER